MNLFVSREWISLALGIVMVYYLIALYSLYLMLGRSRSKVVADESKTMEEFEASKVASPPPGEIISRIGSILTEKKNKMRNTKKTKPDDVRYDEASDDKDKSVKEVIKFSAQIENSNSDEPSSREDLNSSVSSI